MKIAIYGLTITSSWGNGHATTFRSLCKALFQRGHEIDFIEQDVEWYRDNRDMPDPPFCKVHLFTDWALESGSLLAKSSDADVIVIGSYFSSALDLSRKLFERSQQPVFFYDIDTPITMAHLRASGSTAYLSAALIPHYAAYLSFTGGPILMELEEVFGAKKASAFYCSVDPEVYRRMSSVSRFSADLSYLGTYAQDRQSGLSIFMGGPALSQPNMTFLVAGPQYPETLSWPDNVRRITHVSPCDHPRFYSSSRFTLNLTRREMIAAGWSPSVRLFEAAACSTAIISDQWPGLSDFLTPGREILLPTDTAETLYILRHLSDRDREQIGQRAQQRVLDEHTCNHRALEFEHLLSDHSK